MKRITHRRLAERKKAEDHSLKVAACRTALIAQLRQGAGSYAELSSGVGWALADVFEEAIRELSASDVVERVGPGFCNVRFRLREPGV